MENDNWSLSNENVQPGGKETHELVFAFHGGARIRDGTSVRLNGGGYLSCFAEVGGTREEQRQKRREESASERSERGKYRTQRTLEG